MKLLFRAFIIGALVAGCLRIASPVQAVGLYQECKPADQNSTYTCLDRDTCLAAGGQDAGTCGLGAPDEAYCCQRPKAAPPAAVSCEDQNGACRSTCLPDEQSIGQFDCPVASLQEAYLTNTCCKSAALIQSEFDPNADVDGIPTAYDTDPNAPAATPGSSEESIPQLSSPDRLVLPSCVKTGDCKLDDIIVTGVNFATFVMGLSGALFFAVFIYGGALYLLSFGNKSRVEKGKTAIKGAVIGMIFVLGAWTIVNTLVKGLKGQSTAATPASNTAASRCASQGTGYSCVTLNGGTRQSALSDAETKGYSCLTGLCPGAVNVMCCRLK